MFALPHNLLTGRKKAPLSRCFSYTCSDRHAEEVDDDAGEDADEVQDADNGQVPLHAAVGLEEDHEADARTDQEAGHHGADPNDAFQVQLRNDDGGRAVRNEADQARQQFADDRHVDHQTAEILFPDGGDEPV